MQSKVHEQLLLKIVDELKNRYDCHTIILYGSRARGDATIVSDYDLIAIRDKGEMERDCRIVEGVFLDAFIYSIEEINHPDHFLRIKDGIVICQKNKIGDNLLQQVKDLYKKGPTPKSAWEKQLIVTWGQKMLERAKLGDIEGYFRAHWLLYDLLESYFQMRDQWYLGPKEAFQWLKEYDPACYTLFEKVLKERIDLNKLRRLSEYIANISGQFQQIADEFFIPRIQIIEALEAQKICRELIEGLPEWFGIPEANERYIKGCIERTSLAVKVDDAYVGMVTLEFPFTNNANIYWMAVKKEYHGKNIGFQLLQKAEEYCFKHGYRSLTVETLSPKHRDLNYLKTFHFYERCGFKPLFELQPYGPDLAMCYMHKSLSEPMREQEVIFNNEDKLEIVLDYNPAKEDDEFVQEKLFHYETTQLIQGVPKRFSIFIKSSNNEILGGTLVWVHHDSIYVMTLWVDEGLRGKGYGTKLLKMAEEEAIKHGCRYVTLDTHYRGGAFYVKNGYKLLGEIKNYIFKYSKLFYRKDLWKNNDKY